MLSGMAFITGPWISVMIVYNKYFDMQKQEASGSAQTLLKSKLASATSNLTFSDAVTPLIAMESIIIFILITNCYNILREVFRSGILSWHRDNFGAQA